jgi:hypothetical protein
MPIQALALFLGECSQETIPRTRAVDDRTIWNKSKTKGRERGRYGRKFQWMDDFWKAETCVEDDFFHAGGKLILSSDSNISWATVFP